MIGARWRQAREGAGLSAAKAAVATGLHENTIYLLENDRKNEGVTLRVMKQVAAAYGATLAQIFCDDPDSTVTRVPSELRPLHDLLRPLPVEDRTAYVLNVVANARFAASLVANPVSDSNHSRNTDNVSYTSGPNSNEADAFRPVAGLGGAPPGEPTNAPNRADRASRTAAPASKKESR